MTRRSTTSWWWIRHAPVINPDNLIYGRSDVPVDTSDRATFAALADCLPHQPVLITSGLERTHLTAAAIVEAGMQAAARDQDADLDEQHFGDWQGRPASQVYAEVDERHPFWLAPAHSTPPGGESFADLATRVTSAVERLTSDHAGRHIVAVAHGGTIRAALALALGLDPETALRFAIENLSLTRLDYLATEGGGVWRVVAVNQSAGAGGGP